jgi:sugar phosphate isomerase/epimerase
LGVRLVQVADNLPLDQLSPAELDAFQRRASELNVSIEVGTRGIDPHHLATYLQLAERLGSPILRVVIDTPDHHPAKDQVVSTFREIVPQFERAGVCLAIENHDRFKVRELAGIVECVTSPYVGICLDAGNSFGALEGPEAVLEVLGPLTVNLHVKDYAVFRANHMMGFTIEGRPAGQGDLDIPWLLEGLRDLGRDPNAILELWTPAQETVAASIAKEEEWAMASIEYLRQLILH